MPYGNYYFGKNGFLYKKMGGAGGRKNPVIRCNGLINLNNRYISGSGIGAISISNRKALIRNATRCKAFCVNNNNIISGIVQSGININVLRLSNYKVSLYKANEYNAELLAYGITNANGFFSIEYNYEKLTGQYILYLIAEQNNVKLLFIIGNNISAVINQIRPIIINELTTISGIYAFTQLYDINTGSIYGEYKSLNIAAMMTLNLTTYYGTFSNVITSNPNANETNTWQMLNNLCNLMALVIRYYYYYLQLVSLTTIIPSTTLNCFYSICKYPQNNVLSIYNLSNTLIIYTNILKNMPKAFTCAVKFNKTGNNNYLFGGAGNFIFDNNGNIWITNNVIQGTPNSSNFAVVLQPNGVPSNISPMFGGGNLGGGYGICLDNQSNILIGNFGWGGVNPETNGQPEGSITKINQNGTILSPNYINSQNTGGFTTDIYRVQGLKVDNNNNIWMASNGNDRIVVYINGDENNSVFMQLATNAKPFDVYIDNNNNYVVVSCQGDTANNVLAFVYKLYLDSNNVIQTYFSYSDFINTPSFLKVTVDSNDNIFICSQNTNNIYKLSSTGTLITTFSGSGINTPWGCNIDGQNNILVANFNNNSDNLYVISYFNNNGIPISLYGYTLETGGDQVLLANGTPLYGPNKPPCYNPLTKQTGIRVDAAGNVWVTNNWKPDFEVDVTNNPGGDGIVVFLGLAYPILNNLK